MWVVGIDRPFYPQLEFVNSEEEAIKAYNALKVEHEPEGKYDAKVFYAQLKQFLRIKSDY